MATNLSQNFGDRFPRPGSKTPTLSLGKKFALSAVAALLTYSLAEGVVSSVAFFGGRASPDNSFTIFEESHRTFHFDPIRGYRLTTSPSRFARVINGDVEFVGTYRGNQAGFPDDDEFTSHKPGSIARRYMVFGDSFTAAQFLRQNWPDFIEQAVDDRWQLLNFSTDGGGLANWWSNLVHLVDGEEYQYDGMIFAVFSGNLRRGFSVAEHRGYVRHMFGRVDSWDPDDFPGTIDEARPFLRQLGGHILSTSDFDASLRTSSLIGSRQKRPLYRHLWLTRNAVSLARRFVAAGEQRPAATRPPAEFAFCAGQQKLILDIECRLRRRHIRPLVVHIPLREDLLEPPARNPGKEEAREFARLLGATFVDGSEAFAGRSPDEIRADWFPNDGHWCQQGSDRFGRFLINLLRT